MWGRELQWKEESGTCLTLTLFTSSRPWVKIAPQRGSVRKQPMGMMNEASIIKCSIKLLETFLSRVMTSTFFLSGVNAEGVLTVYL